jgi:hypothetical protein
MVMPVRPSSFSLARTGAKTTAPQRFMHLQPAQKRISDRYAPKSWRI